MKASSEADMEISWMTSMKVKTGYADPESTILNVWGGRGGEKGRLFEHP